MKMPSSRTGPGAIPLNEGIAQKNEEAGLVFHPASFFVHKELIAKNPTAVQCCPVGILSTSPSSTEPPSGFWQ